jgi:hypothetical protein
LFSILHLALTVALAVALLTAVLFCLNLMASIHAGQKPDGEEKTDKEDKEDNGDKGGPGGRYQIETQEDIRGLLGRAGPLGFFGEPIAEAWAYRYKGGYVQCHLEVETHGKTAVGPPIPDKWENVLATDPAVKEGNPEAMDKEGYIVLTAMRPVIPVNEALEPYYPHLGGLFVSGPAGPLHQLTNASVESSHWRFYRILLTAGAPKGSTGPGFNTYTTHNFNARQPLVARDPAEEPVNIGSGKDLIAGKDITLLECQRGHTKIRLKARFLTDDEVKEIASKPPAAPRR